jgi:tRNA dimethylallyltransferase
MDNKPLIVIVGPTAVGKTEIAIQLAEMLGGEIVSADSRLFYRGMDIGTAKPTINERERVPHYLIDIINPDQPWSLGEFKKAAHQAIAAIQAKKKMPFLVGGTGLYVKAIIEEWSIPPIEPDNCIRKILEDWSKEIGAVGLHQKLALLDAESAQMIDYRNLRRTIRAIEVILKTGRKFSSQRKKVESPYSPIIVGLNRPRPELYQRIDLRIESMIEHGMIDEVQQLLKQGYTTDMPSFSAIGYREIAAFIQRQSTLDEAIVLMKRYTRQYVRRQANWFKKTDPSIMWFDVGDNTVTEIKDYIIGKIEKLE